jgi:hypothetical protein
MYQRCSHLTDFYEIWYRGLYADLSRSSKWSLLHNLATCMSWILSTVSSLVILLVCKFSLPIWTDLKGCIIFVSYCHSLAELAYSRSTSVLSLEVRILDRNLLVATGQWLYLNSLSIGKVMYLISKLTTCLFTLKCTFEQVIVHNSIFVMPSGCHMLVTCLSRAALDKVAYANRHNITLYVQLIFL